jgi:group I intron endonuclease
MIIYKVTNLYNNKIYIGQSRKNDPSYLGSGKLILEAVAKYGKKNFKKEILETVESISELDIREIYWIAYFKKLGYTLYNIHEGGTGYSQKVLAEYWKNKKVTDKKHIEKILSSFQRSPLILVNTLSKNIKKKIKPLDILSVKNNMTARAKKVYQFSIDGKLLNIFESLEHAYRSLQNATSKGNLSCACRGKRNVYGGYRWSYSNECHPIEFKKKGRPEGTKNSFPIVRNHINSTSYTIVQYDGELIIREWESADEISKVLNISKQLVARATKNNKEYKGYIWKRGKDYVKTQYLNKDSNTIKLKK